MISTIILLAIALVPSLLTCEVPNKKIFCKLREHSSSSLVKIINFNTCLCTNFVLDLKTTKDGLRVDDDETEFLQKKTRKRGKKPSIFGSIPFRNISNQKPEQISMLLKRNQLSGVIVKWNDEDVNTIRIFLKDLKPFIGNNSISLFLSSQGINSSRPIDLQNISSLVDYIILPVFYWDSINDKHHQGKVRRIADIDTLDSIIGNLLRWGVSKSKIILTVSIFGIHTLTDKGKMKSVTRIPYSKVCSYRESDGWTLEREMDQTSPFITKANASIAFDDEISLKLKSKYIILQKLAGIFAESVFEDDSDNLCKKDEYPLLQNIYKVFSGKKHQNSTNIDNLKEYLDNSESKTLIRKSGSVFTYKRSGIQCTREGYYQYPGNCRLFYRCVKYHQLSDDFTVYHYGCPDGLIFDERYEVCNWPSWSDHCIGSGEIINVPKNKFICPGPGYFRDPENCRWFYYCSDHGVPRPYEFKCPYDLAYDEIKHLCNWRWLVPGCSKKEDVELKVYPISGQSAVEKGLEYVQRPNTFGPSSPTFELDPDKKVIQKPNYFDLNNQEKSEVSLPPPPFVLKKDHDTFQFDSNKEIFPPNGNYNTNIKFPSDTSEHLYQRFPFPIIGGTFSGGSGLTYNGYTPCNCELDSIFLSNPPHWSAGFGPSLSHIHQPFGHLVSNVQKEVTSTSLKHKLLFPLSSLSGRISHKKHLIWNPISKLRSFLHGIFSLITAGIPIALFKSGSKFGESPFTVTVPVNHVPFPEHKFPYPPINGKHHEYLNKPSPPVNIFIINTGNKFETITPHQKIPSFPHENGGIIINKLPGPNSENIPINAKPVKQIYDDYKYIPPAPIKNENVDVGLPPFADRPKVDGVPLQKPFENVNGKYEARPPLLEIGDQNSPPDNKPEPNDNPLSPPRPDLDGDPLPKQVTYYKHMQLHPRPNPNDGIAYRPRPEPNSGIIKSAEREKSYSYNYREPPPQQQKPDTDDFELLSLRPEKVNDNVPLIRPIKYYNNGNTFNSQSKPEPGPKFYNIPTAGKSVKYFDDPEKDIPLFAVSRPEPNTDDDIPKDRPAKIYVDQYKDSAVPPSSPLPESEPESDLPPGKSFGYSNNNKFLPELPASRPVQEEYGNGGIPPPPYRQVSKYYNNQHQPGDILLPPYQQTTKYYNNQYKPSAITELGSRDVPPGAQSWSNDDNRKVVTFSKSEPDDETNSHYPNGDRLKYDYGSNLVQLNFYPDSACTRPGLFRHYENCNKFYECYWDKWINKFTLHSFECPVKLVFNENILGCSSPSIRIPCGGKK